MRPATDHKGVPCGQWLEKSQHGRDRSAGDGTFTSETTPDHGHSRLTSWTMRSRWSLM